MMSPLGDSSCKEGEGDSKASSHQRRGSRDDNGPATKMKAAGGCSLLGLWGSIWVQGEKAKAEMSFEQRELG